MKDINFEAFEKKEEKLLIVSFRHVLLVQVEPNRSLV